MITYFYLFIGHLIGESLFSKWLSEAKRRSLFFLGVHSAVYAITVLIFIYLLISRHLVFWKFGILFGSHFSIDYWKCYIARVEANINAASFRYSVLDQILHLLVLALAVTL